MNDYTKFMIKKYTSQNRNKYIYYKKVLNKYMYVK